MQRGNTLSSTASVHGRRTGDGLDTDAQFLRWRIRDAVRPRHSLMGATSCCSFPSDKGQVESISPTSRQSTHFGVPIVQDSSSALAVAHSPVHSGLRYMGPTPEGHYRHRYR